MALSQRRRKNAIAGILLVALLGYAFYIFGGAESRMRKICAEITPGMSFGELEVLATDRGLLPPHRESGLNILAETKSFGRWACMVTLENGVVSKSEYNFAD